MYVVRARGLEPLTYGLKVRCSTNWATPAFIASVGYVFASFFVSLTFYNNYTIKIFS